MPRALNSVQLGDVLRPGARVYWPGGAGHSALFEQWLGEHAQGAAGVEFCGAWIPGVNQFDPTALHPQARATSFFLPPHLHAGWLRGAVDLLPLHYSEISQYLSAPGRFDVLMLQVSPPDDAGLCSLSLAADFTPAAMQGLAADAVVLAHVNPLLPRTRGPSVPVARIDAWVEAPIAPLTLDDGPLDPAWAGVAQQVAALVRDGDTLQFGVGKLQSAVLAALHGHRGLRLHSGMVSDGLLGLMASGAMAAPSMRSPPVCTGLALGSPLLYAAVADPAWAQFAPVSFTHAHATLAALPRLVAINSALEIDLLGQVNVEVLGGRRVSGVGGLVDFIRGARASAGGRGIVAATACAGREQQSRIVPLLPPQSVSMGRADADTVVTEHGHAGLRSLGVEARAQALIAIAAPQHRAALLSAWHTLRRNF